MPSAFTVPTGEAHWHVLLRARAIETGAYVLAPAQSGTHAARRAGRRGGPTGTAWRSRPGARCWPMRARGSGVVFVEVDPAEVARARGMVPSLGHDRDYAPPVRP